MRYLRTNFSDQKAGHVQYVRKARSLSVAEIEKAFPGVLVSVRHRPPVRFGPSVTVVTEPKRVNG